MNWFHEPCAGRSPSWWWLSRSRSAGPGVRQMPRDIFPTLGIPTIYVAQPLRRHCREDEGYLTYYYDIPTSNFMPLGHSSPSQLDWADAIYQSLASKQLVIASDQHLESRRQKRTLCRGPRLF